MESLEQKLDGLVSLIKSTHDIRAPQVIDQGHQLAASTLTSMASTAPYNGLSTPTSTVTSEQLVSRPPLDSISDTMFPMPDFRTANEHLDLFRDQFAPHFPFIVLPKSVRAETLCVERPFFYISILAMVSRDTDQRIALGKVVVHQLAEKVFVKCERSLDLLLGILTYGAW